MKRIFFILLLLCLTLAHDAFSQSKVYWSETPASGITPVYSILRADLNGGFPELVAHSTQIKDMAFDEVSHSIFLANNSGATISRLELNPLSPPQILLHDISADSLALDAARGKIYWVGSLNPSSIFSSNLDGTGKVTLLSGLAPAVSYVRLDPPRAKIYWGNSVGEVYRANLDGSAIEFITSFKGPAIAGMAIDSLAHQIYIGASGQTVIRQVDLLTKVKVTPDPVIQDPYVPAINLAIDPHPGIRQLYGTVTGAVELWQSGPNVYLPKTSQISNNQNPAQGLFLALPCDASSLDTDNDGTPDCMDSCPVDALKISAGACGCGISDIDSDADGIPDCKDFCPADAHKSVPGACGCGVSELDSDRDTLPDCIDRCPNDALKSSPGLCGCGLVENPDLNNSITCDPGLFLLDTTQLLAGPDVTVIRNSKGKFVVKIFFKKFIGARSIKLLQKLFSQKKALSGLLSALASASGIDFSRSDAVTRPRLSVQFKAFITRSGLAKSNISTYQTKRNVLSVSNLRPGSYQVRYRALAIRSGKVVIRTKLSPATSFSIPKR